VRDLERFGAKKNVISPKVFSICSKHKMYAVLEEEDVYFQNV
jgi:hypothetical protein